MAEAETRYLIDKQLVENGQVIDVKSIYKDVVLERNIESKRADYSLTISCSGGWGNKVAIIEAKAGHKDINKALEQAERYAVRINCL